MFKKVLIANRGEIAVRIIKTCKEMAIATVAIYSKADKDSLHVKMADEAYCVGGPLVAQSYLNGEQIIQIAKEAGVDAIHPGYGLLSENSQFAQACEDAKIVFIGPSVESIEKMGSKIISRQTMMKAGIPVVPGVTNNLGQIEDALEAAENIGYPLMLKASGGGGGIGMGIVKNEEELVKLFERNKHRAKSFFGNDDMYMEKVIAPAHHIEVQVIGDMYGNLISLYDRECSVQRRNQKVIEEAPSPFLTEELREIMMNYAIKGAQAIGYYNAGTFEFLVDEQKNIYFLEMNTRLQVEHPVTEQITGYDIVALQLKVAAKESLQVLADNVKKEGYSIEARIYAEDPTTFYPSPGTITRIHLPTDIRMDHYIVEGMQVTPYYDPLLGKIIAYGKTRDEAINQLKQALQTLRIDGIKTNIALLLAVLDNDSFRKGAYSTTIVDDCIHQKGGLYT
ncbi:MAG: acetyl/propionyl/methylcrotonyl-CoA carboxylase subunit alpha [Bacillaceae bacterium]